MEFIKPDSYSDSQWNRVISLIDSFDIKSGIELSNGEIIKRNGDEFTLTTEDGVEHKIESLISVYSKLKNVEIVNESDEYNPKLPDFSILQQPAYYTTEAWKVFLDAIGFFDNSDGLLKDGLEVYDPQNPKEPMLLTKEWNGDNRFFQLTLKNGETIPITTKTKLYEMMWYWIHGDFVNGTFYPDVTKNIYKGNDYFDVYMNTPEDIQFTGKSEKFGDIEIGISYQPGVGMEVGVLNIEQDNPIDVSVDFPKTVPFVDVRFFMEWLESNAKNLTEKIIENYIDSNFITE